MRQSEDFSTTVRGGVRTGRTSVVVHVLPDATGAGSPTVGFVVSKAVGSAVQRNRVKRRLRHAMRAHLARLQPGCRVVVRALPASAGTPSSTLATELEAALARAGAW